MACVTGGVYCGRMPHSMSALVFCLGRKAAQNEAGVKLKFLAAKPLATRSRRKNSKPP